MLGVDVEGSDPVLVCEKSVDGVVGKGGVVEVGKGCGGQFGDAPEVWFEQGGPLLTDPPAGLDTVQGETMAYCVDDQRNVKDGERDRDRDRHGYLCVYVLKWNGRDYICMLYGSG